MIYFIHIEIYQYQQINVLSTKQIHIVETFLNILFFPNYLVVSILRQKSLKNEPKCVFQNRVNNNILDDSISIFRHLEHFKVKTFSQHPTISNDLPYSLNVIANISQMLSKHLSLIMIHTLNSKTIDNKQIFMFVLQNMYAETTHLRVSYVDFI